MRKHAAKRLHFQGAVTLAALLLCVLLLLAPSGCRRRKNGPTNGDRRVVTSGGVERSYTVHVPPSYRQGEPVPLVFVFHGGGGEGAGMAEVSGFNAVSDSGGFIVVYPDGIDKNWNDGRPQINPGVDDVGFVRDMLARLQAEYSIDTARVYATGISNGGFMSYRLAIELDGTFAAIAPVGALLTEQLYSMPPPATPVSVLLIEGVDDPFVPWEGGGVGVIGGRRGTVVSAEATLDYWVKVDGCGATPVATDLADSDPDDGTTVREELYGGGREGSEVELLAIEGGGHTWPGGLQYLPERTIGRTSRDILASQVIWDFFKAHSLPQTGG